MAMKNPSLSPYTAETSKEEASTDMEGGIGQDKVKPLSGC